MVSFLEHLNNKVLIWLPDYLKKSIIRSNSNRLPGTKHIMFIFVDHFEPQVQGATEEKQKERVDIWMEKYPTIASRFADADGKHPQHTWFYPYDEYRSEDIKLLSQLSYDGFGEIEMHLHHRNDTSDSLRRKLNGCKAEFAKFGALITAERNPRSVYGFIHGNWGLDNSRGISFCGVDNELQVLSETDCFADFTFPSPGHSSQPRKINSIYYAKDDPDRPKSYDQGADVTVGGNGNGDLMIIQGILGLHWKNRKYYILPRIETGNITDVSPPNKDRIDYWIKTNIHVIGRPNWIFVKIYTHGAWDHNMSAVLGHPVMDMHSYLTSRYNDGIRFKLHYVTAREAYNIIKAAEAGEEGDPNQYRDYIIKPYANTRIKGNKPYQLISYSQDNLEMRVLKTSPEAAVFEYKDIPLRRIEGNLSALHYSKTSENEATLWLKGKGDVCFYMLLLGEERELLNARALSSFGATQGYGATFKTDIDGETKVEIAFARGQTKSLR